MALIERQAVLQSTREVGPSIRLFRFSIPELDSFPFVPGQWVSLVAEVAGKPVTRAYSLASLPHGNEFEICLNLVPDGLFTPFLFQLEPGARISLKGPVGAFTLRNPGKPAILVATGTGIVPFRPMLQQPDFLAQDANVTLVFGARYETGLVFHDEFAALAARYPSFRFLPTVTRPSDAWRGAAGRVQSLLWPLIGERTDFDVYVCGLKEMVDDVRNGLKERGFDRKQIIFEKYD